MRVYWKKDQPYIKINLDKQAFTNEDGTIEKERWLDKDEILYKVIGEIFIRFIEDEKPLEVFEYEEEHKNKLKEIYNFFKNEIPKYEKKLEYLYSKLKFPVIENLKILEKNALYISDKFFDRILENNEPIHQQIQSLNEELQSKKKHYCKEVIEIADCLWT